MARLFYEKKPSVASITKESKQIFSIFTQTKDDCIALNEKITGIVTGKEEEIKALQNEVSELTTIKTGHVNLANKIDTFLNT